MQSHTMELPRLIVVGENNMNEIGEFLFSLNKPKIVSLISGINVQKILKQKIEKSLKLKKIKFVWHTSKDNQVDSIKQIEKDVKKDHSNLVVGIGGGRSVDTAKMVSFNLELPFVSVPTAASHDGMASPFVSVKTDKPHRNFFMECPNCHKEIASRNYCRECQIAICPKCGAHQSHETSVSWPMAFLGALLLPILWLVMFLTQTVELGYLFGRVKCKTCNKGFQIS